MRRELEILFFTYANLTTFSDRQHFQILLSRIHTLGLQIYEKENDTQNRRHVGLRVRLPEKSKI
jgi:hypothetical protein